MNIYLYIYSSSFHSYSRATTVKLKAIIHLSNITVSTKSIKNTSHAQTQIFIELFQPVAATDAGLYCSNIRQYSTSTCNRRHTQYMLTCFQFKYVAGLVTASTPHKTHNTTTKMSSTYYVWGALRTAHSLATHITRSRVDAIDRVKSIETTSVRMNAARLGHRLIKSFSMLLNVANHLLAMFTFLLS